MKCGYRVSLVLALILGSGAPSLRAAEPPVVDFILPAGGATNLDLTVRVGGQLGPLPLTAWCDDAGVTFTATGTNGEYRVTFATNAVPGAHWVRFANSNGVSAPRLFVTSDAVERVENEATNAPPPAVQEIFPVVFNGRLRQPGEVDAWPIRCGTNEIVRARLLATGIDSPLQASLTLVGEDGSRIATSPEAPGQDPTLAAGIPNGGTFRVEVRTLVKDPTTNNPAAGGEAAVYQLMVAKESVSSATNAPPEADLLVTDASWLRPAPVSVPLALPARILGWIDPPGDEDRFVFTAKAGLTYYFRAQAGALGSPLLPIVRVLDPDTHAVAESGPGADPDLTWTAGVDGDYSVSVTGRDGRGGPNCFYRLDLDSPRAQIGASVDLHTVLLSPGGTAELQVEIRKPDRFDQLLAALVGGLPADVTAAPVHVGPTDTRGKIVLTAAPGAHTSSQPCRIIVTSIEAVPHAALAEALVKGRYTPPGELVRNTADHFWLLVGPPAGP